MSQPDDNLSCLLYGPGKVRYEHRPLPVIEDPSDVLVKISFVGVCGSDVHFWKHGGVTRRVSEEQPLIMGHEASGIVHAVGPAVTTLKPGDHVAIEPGSPCRRCKLCKSGRYNLCPDMRFAADPPHTHGTLTRMFRIPADFAYKIPDSVSLEEAVLIEPLSVAVHSVRLSDLRPGQSVLVLGSGTIGILVAATARAYGAHAVCISDISKPKLDFVIGLVDSIPFTPDRGKTPKENADNVIRSLGEGAQGFDVVLECTGVESSAQTGLHALLPGGTFVQVGLGKCDQTIPLAVMCEKEIVLKTSFRYAPGDYEIALGLLAAGKVAVSPLISSTVPFERASEAWERTANGQGIKNLIRCGEDNQADRL